MERPTLNTFKEHLIEDRTEQRRADVDQVRKFLGDIAEEYANYFDNYEDFKQVVLKHSPELEEKPGGVVVLPSDTGPVHVDLKWLYNNHNTGERERFTASWDEYGRERAAGTHVSRDGWTGD